MENLYQVYAFIFASMIGSFLNVVIHRLPKGEDLVFKRSHCPKCNNLIVWYQNIPLFSYLFLRGKCSQCKARIKFRYFLVELITGITGWYLYISVGVGVTSVIYFIIACLFICHFFIDIDHQILPDSLNFILFILALILVGINGTWKLSLIGAAMGFGGTLLITWVFYLIKGKIGLGGGDIKLFGILGLLFGPLGIAQNIFFSCLIGSVVMIGLILSGTMKKDQPIAFGPFIIVVASIQLFFPRFFQRVFELLNDSIAQLL